MTTRITPAAHQPPLPMDRLLARGPAPEGTEEVPVDVLFVGGGPAGLAGAIELARLVKGDPALAEIQIAVLDKSERLGEHCLSGAVVNPVSLRALFPGLKDADFPFRGPAKPDRVYWLSERGKRRLPAPPTMRNEGHFICSICELVRWMGERAEELGVNIFTGFPADSLLVEGDEVRGVRTAAKGLNRDGSPGDSYQPPSDVTARITVLAEGTRGSLSQAYLEWQNIGSPNPQIFALGVKELWQVTRPLEAIVHTLGWPLPRDAFGGSFFYPMGADLVAVGLVVGLDYRSHALDPHILLQRLKGHPLFRKHLDGGKMVEWGAKTIPEGGLYSIPDRLHGNGVLMVGDAAGLVNVASLKGIHYAVQSGILAARAVAAALKGGAASREALAPFDAAVRDSFIAADLRKTRNMRLGFKKGFIRGGVTSALATVSGGALPAGRIATPTDAAEPRDVTARPGFQPDGRLTFSKLDANFLSGNTTRDDIPLHVIAAKDVPPDVAEFYEHMCPAGVYERRDGALVINAANCIDCKATDVLGPRWTAREAGSGPRYKAM
jgi:electron-transferring-flavoprotein dehydrogenase